MANCNESIVSTSTKKSDKSSYPSNNTINDTGHFSNRKRFLINRRSKLRNSKISSPNFKLGTINFSINNINIAFYGSRFTLFFIYKQIKPRNLLFKTSKLRLQLRAARLHGVTCFLGIRDKTTRQSNGKQKKYGIFFMD